MSASVVIPVFAIIISLCLVIYTIKQARTETLRERLLYGFDEDEEEENPVTIWRNAADLLYLTRLRRLLEKSPLARKLNHRLSCLELAHIMPQIVLILIIVLFLTMIIVNVFTDKPAFVLTALIIEILIFWYTIKTIANRRIRTVERQLPMFVNQMITTLRAGGTTASALRVASINTPKPLGPSITQLVEAIQIGVPPGRAWKEWSQLWQSKSCDLLSTAIRLKWDAGGELSTILEVILEQLEARRQRELRIQTLTSMAQLSTYVLIALPILLLIWTAKINPTLYAEMINHDVGSKALIGMAILMTIGFFWLRKIAKLED
ncbi:MAG: type II secretion system F family protein [Thiotrichales bacterium]|nr:type II secretion system F family protein [Thiotrichales bacterium]